MIDFGFDNHLSGKLRAGYTEPTLFIDAVSYSWTISCLRPMCFCKLGNDEKYESIGFFAHVSYSIFAPRKRFLVRSISSIFTILSVGLRHCSGKERKLSCERSGSCLRKGAAAHDWTTNPFRFCSTPYRLAETSLPNPRGPRGSMPAPQRGVAFRYSRTYLISQP